MELLLNDNVKVRNRPASLNPIFISFIEGNKVFCLDSNNQQIIIDISILEKIETPNVNFVLPNPSENLSNNEDAAENWDTI